MEFVSSEIQELETVPIKKLETVPNENISQFIPLLRDKSKGSIT